MLNPTPVHDDASILEMMSKQPHFVGDFVIEKDVFYQQKLQAIEPNNQAHSINQAHPDDVIEDELDLNQDEQVSNFSVTKFVLTSMTSLIATCGIGFLMTGKTDVSIDAIDKSLPLSNAPSKAENHHSANMNLPKPTPTKPEVITSPDRSATAKETERLVKEALTEYYASLNQSINAKSLE
jgi:hypothetical protein